MLIDGRMMLPASSPDTGWPRGQGVVRVRTSP